MVLTLQEEEAPPLPPDEPPQPPLPPEGDQLDDEVNPPVPESPPPLPPDDAQLGHVEMVQLAVSQTGQKQILRKLKALRCLCGSRFCSKSLEPCLFKRAIW